MEIEDLQEPELASKLTVLSVWWRTQRAAVATFVPRRVLRPADGGCRRSRLG